MAKTNHIYGVHAVQEALVAGKRIDKILLRKDVTSDLRGTVMAAAKAANIPVQYVPLEKLDRLAPGANHQGVIALAAQIDYVELEDMLLSFQDRGKNAFIVLLDGVTDVRNLGAIARSAECMGADLLVLPLHGSAQINADSMKISAGALNHLPVSRVSHAIDALNLLDAYGIQSLALTEKTETTLFEVDLTQALCLIVGDEEVGIQPRILKQATTLASIPMQGRISSLNVSVAAGMAMLEVVRQRGK